jgi:hypothetical protein
MPGVHRQLKSVTEKLSNKCNELKNVLILKEVFFLNLNNHLIVDFNKKLS